MTALKIGVVEDEVIIAESIVVTLQEIGYKTTWRARNYDEALERIEADRPDLLLIDIELDGKQDGIDLAQKINEDHRIPFIFLTANSDKGTVSRAKEVGPAAYLVKPFTEKDLFTSIEIAFNNYRKPATSVVSPVPKTDTTPEDLYIREGEVFHRVPLKDVTHVESENVYLNIYTRQRRYVARTKLDDFLDQYSGSQFVRVHRSYAINLRHLETINTLSVGVGGKEIPLQKNYKDSLLETVKTIK